MDADGVIEQLVADGYLLQAEGSSAFSLTRKGGLLLAFCLDTMTGAEMAASASLAVSLATEAEGGEEAPPWRRTIVTTPQRGAVSRPQGGGR